jgi:serine protease Do
MFEVRKRAVAMGFLVLAACGSSDEGAAQALRQETPPVVREQLGDAASQRPELATAQALSATFRAAASHALPAVVNIEVQKPGGAAGQEIPEQFRRFFGLPPGGRQEPEEVPGAGSGFVIDDQGHVITNNHVVEGATSVIVKLVDGREFTAKVVGTDPMTDVAVLKIAQPANGKPLPIAELGDSSSLQVGDWVLALGSPLELEFTVTTGIVSAMGRQLTNRPSALEAFIQTDAAINPGNSGGPLVDLTGRVVGINTAIFGGPRFVGYGFAIPVNLAKKVVHDILEFGRVRRPQLGIQIQPVTEADAEVYGLPEIRGAEVVNVQPGSPAARAGLRIGDVILELDGKMIQNATDLTTKLAQYQPEETVRLTLFRDKQHRNVSVVLGEFEQEASTAEPRPEPHAVEQALGFRVEPLTEQIAQQLEIDRTRGVVVASVGPLSAAGRAGVRPGMVVLAINGREVATVRDVERIAREIGAGQVVSLRVEAAELGELIINYRTRR